MLDFKDSSLDELRASYAALRPSTFGMLTFGVQ